MSNIDINSRNCMSILGDTAVVVTGLALPSAKGVRTIMFDFDGEVIQDRVITKDSELSNEWPVDALYLEDYYLVAVEEEYQGEARRASIYKIDYNGILLDHMRFPYYWKGEILTLAQLQSGNLFISQAYIDEGECLFEHEVPSIRNAAIFYEVDIENFEIVKSKDHICYQSISGVGYDCQIMPNGEILRTVIWSDPFDENVNNAAIIRYDEEWNETSIYKYDLLEIVWPYSFGTLSNKIFQSELTNHYFVTALNRYAVSSEIYFIDQVVQKWTANHELIWSRVIKSPNINKRFFLTELEETNTGIVLAGSVWPDIEDVRSQSFAIMSLDSMGCYNGNCNDTIYLDGGPVSTIDIKEEIDIKLFPNPSTSKITIASKLPILEYSMINNQSRLIIESTRYNSQVLELDLPNYPKGIYFLRLRTKEGEETKKVIKI